jgi:hypothetical protein
MAKIHQPKKLHEITGKNIKTAFRLLGIAI